MFTNSLSLWSSKKINNGRAKIYQPGVLSRKRRICSMDKKHMKKLGFTSIEGYITEDFGADEAPERMEFEAGVDHYSRRET